MNGKELLITAEIISNEKKLDKDIVFRALEKSLAVASRKDFGRHDIVVKIDKKTGLYEIYKNILVVDDNELEFDSMIHIYQDQAEEKYGKNFEIGDKIEEFISSEPLSRMAAQVFKQSIKESIRRAQKEEWQKDYYNKKGQIVYATVKKFVSGDVVLSVTEDIEGILPKNELIGYERFTLGQRIMVVLDNIVDNYKGQQLIFSRASKNFVLSLMKKEIPDVGEGNIEVVSISRIAGFKTKVVVKSIVPHLDPVRECLGHKSNRIKVISQEMNNEIVEIINYEENFVDYVISLLRPNEIQSLYLDEQKNKLYVSVEESILGKAKGRDNLNEKMISEILGLFFNIVTQSELEEIENNSIYKISNDFQKYLNVDEELANILVMEGFEDFESIYLAPIEDMLSIEGFDKELVEILKKAAFEAMSIQEREEKERMYLLGISEEETEILYNNEIKSLEDIADLSTYELMDYIDINEDKASAVIMKAREVWG